MTIPKTLIRRLRAGRVIPFVGAGVSMAVERADGGGRLFPSWHELMQHGADRLKEEGKSPDASLVRSVMEIDEPDILYAARHLRNKLGPVWSEFLREQIDVPRVDVDSESLALARAVWGLGSRLIVTTNYDQVLKWACPEELHDDLGAWDIKATSAQAQFLSEGTVAPTVWHLHGRIRNVARLILTPNGYERLYSSDSKDDYRAALETLRHLLVARSLLFIGFSLDDEHFGIEMRGMAEVFEGYAGPHYALVRERNADGLRRQGLPVEILTFEDFGRPLRELVEELGRCAASEPVARTGADPVEPTAAAEAVELSAYLEALVSRTDHINISGISGAAAAKGALRHPIEQLYTPLASRAARQQEHSDANQTVGELVTLADLLPFHERLLIEGQPGAGKTTFLRLMASMLARDGLGRTCPDSGSSSSSDSETHSRKGPATWRGKYLGFEDDALRTPVWLRIADLVPLLKAEGAELRTDDHRWILDLLERTCSENNYAVSRDAWRAMLRDGSATLLLDGLDEVADETTRERIFEVFRDACLQWKCPIVVTSRPIQTAALVEMGFHRATIEPFSDQDIRAFVDRWVAALYGESTAELRNEGKSYRDDLMAAMIERPRVRRLATNPVMLTCLCVVHWNEGHLPDGRSRVYRAVIRWLIAAKRKLRKEQGFSDRFSERALARLAHSMIDSPDGKRTVFDLEEGAVAIDTLLEREFPNLDSEERRYRARQWLSFECLGSGIVEEVAGKRVRFWHLTFQEFLAALQLAWRGDGDDPEKDWWPVVSARLADVQWRETIELFPGCLLDEGGEGRVDRLLERVLDLGRGGKGDLASQAWVAGVVGRLLEPLTVYEYKPRPEIAMAYSRALGRSLAIFSPEGAASVSVRVRAAAAEALGQAGDPRLRRDNLLLVPGLEGWRLGKYPVSVEEYQHFVDHQGYEKRECWSHEGWSEKESQGWLVPGEWDEQLLHPNRPVVMVSWSEAEAYCRWLSDQRSEEVRLPKEAEWESAATPETGDYPWGTDEPDTQRANFTPARRLPQIGSPTPVGIYPLGDGPSGHCDLAGNVWEWCRDSVGEERVLQGGCWDSSAGSLRADYRFTHLPSARFAVFGFRVLAAPVAT